MQETLAKVTSFYLGTEGHGILTLTLMLDYGGAGQGTPAIALDTYDKAKQRRVGHALCGEYILSLLNLFRVKKLEEIVGRPVIALRDDGAMGLIVGLKIPEFDGGKALIFADIFNQF